jgi:hypothetical protein
LNATATAMNTTAQALQGGARARGLGRILKGGGDSHSLEGGGGARVQGGGERLVASTQTPAQMREGGGGSRSGGGIAAGMAGSMAAGIAGSLDIEWSTSALESVAGFFSFVFFLVFFLRVCSMCPSCARLFSWAYLY